MSEVNLNAYLERIGYSGSIAPTLQTLEALHALHPATIPFENLNPLLGLPVRLDTRSLEQKLLHERRGGYCYEHNLTLLRVLRELGYAATGLAARVLWNRPADAVTPRSHMLILVEIGGASYIADAGFGGMTLTAPLRLKADVEQETPHELFRLLGGPDYRLEAKVGEEWRPLYRFDLSEQLDVDYEAPNWWAATHPESHFRQRLIVARAEKGRRISLSDSVLSTYPVGAEPLKETLGSTDELREALAGRFGLALPPAELLDPVLERIVAEAGQA